ncbi:hypothetical protein [Streptomyces sp. NPDC046976]|uniref:hypothetical protein n=1 Tax=Streptomyces sp. NPDC046976 TaxID=3155258 RepID=UPI0033D11EA8
MSDNDIALDGLPVLPAGSVHPLRGGRQPPLPRLASGTPDHAFHDLPPGMVCENLRSLRADEPGHVRQVDLSPELSWEHVRRLRALTGLCAFGLSEEQARQVCVVNPGVLMGVR